MAATREACKLRSAVRGVVSLLMSVGVCWGFLCWGLEGHALGDSGVLVELTGEGATLESGNLVAADIELAEDVYGFDETVLSPAPAGRAGLVEGVEPAVE